MAKLIVLALAVCAFAIGGFANFTQTLISLIAGSLCLFVLVLGLFVCWKNRKFKRATKWAITLFVAAGVSFWLFFLVQPPPEVTDGQFTHFGLLWFAGLSFVCGIGCGVSAWRQGDDYFPRPIGFGPRYTFGENPSRTPIIPASAVEVYPAATMPRCREASVVDEDVLRQIDWYQFEKVMERVLKLEGFLVTRLGGAKADGGVDIVAEREGKKTVVQCKHWKNPVTPKTVREAIGIRVTQCADEIVLATLNSGTVAALECAQLHGVIVSDKDEIFDRMQRIGLAEFSGLLDPSNKFCPRCDAPMVFRNGRGKRFWGCSNYGRLRCMGTIEA